MRQQEVFNKIGSIINELSEQYDYLKNQPVPLDDLELELFTANANFLTDHLEILRKLNTSLEKGNQAGVNLRGTENNDLGSHDVKEPAALADVAPIEEHFETEDVQAKPQVAAFEFDITPAATDQEYLKDDPAFFEAPVPDTVTEQKVEQITAQGTDTHEINLKPDTGNDHFSFIRSTKPDVVHHELEISEADTFTKEEPEQDKETVADAMAEIANATAGKEEITDEPQTSFTPEQEQRPLTFNERMAQQSNAGQQQKELQPITDLKAAINLNDKMLFVRDLFNGYSLAYSEAIEILNRFSKLEDAERFLSVNYEAKNNWADKPATRDKFFELLKRRFV